MKKSKKSHKRTIYRTLAASIICIIVMTMPAYATVQGVDTIISVLDQMIDIVGVIFQAVGIILSVYAVGTLVLAFKNEDADSKSRASTMLVVGVVLLALPSIIDGLNLTQHLR